MTERNRYDFVPLCRLYISNLSMTDIICVGSSSPAARHRGGGSAKHGAIRQGPPQRIVSGSKLPLPPSHRCPTSLSLWPPSLVTHIAWRHHAFCLVVAIAGDRYTKTSKFYHPTLLSLQFNSSFKDARPLTSNTSSKTAKSFAAKEATMLGVNCSDEQSILSPSHRAHVLNNPLGGSVKGFRLRMRQ